MRLQKDFSLQLSIDLFSDYTAPHPFGFDIHTRKSASILQLIHNSQVITVVLLGGPSPTIV